MIYRYIVATIFAVVFTLAIILPNSGIKIPTLSMPKPQVEAAKSAIGVYPIPVDNFQNAPETSARSVYIIDVKSGVSLYEKNPNLKHLPASTTKLMTALVALEKCSPETVVTVGGVQKTGNQMGLAPGDQVTVENLTYGLLIKSGNDAAYALANSCAESYPKFIETMNEKAKALDMPNTHFANPAGFDDSLQYSTAADLAKLAKVAVGNPLIAKIVSTKSTVVTDVSSNKNYYLQNVNELLGEVNGVEGVKTGQTEGSMEILITKTTRNNNSIIVAVLGSSDRFAESKNLIEWSFGNYNWVSP